MSRKLQAKMWIAKNGDGNVYLYPVKPKWDENRQAFIYGAVSLSVCFPLRFFADDILQPGQAVEISLLLTGRETRLGGDVTTEYMSDRDRILQFTVQNDHETD